MLLCQTFLSAVAGVYNQRLYKAEDTSLHACNMALYAAGVCINPLVYIISCFIKPNVPGFFSGYNTFAAVMVIVSNVLIGLAITAVYKCKWQD